MYRFLIVSLVCSGQHDYLSSDNALKATLWSLIESPFDPHTHLFFASQTPTRIPPDMLSLLNCVVCHRFGSAAWAAHLTAHFTHSAVPLEDYAPKLGSGEALLFAPEGASLGGSDDGALRRWNGGCIRLKVAGVKSRESETPQEVESTSGVLSRSGITVPMDTWAATNGTAVPQPHLSPPPQPAPLRRAVTPQPSFPFRSPPLSFRHLDNDLTTLYAQEPASRGSSHHHATSAIAFQHPSPSSKPAEQMPHNPEFPVPFPAASSSLMHGTVPLIIDDQDEPTAPMGLVADPAPAISHQANVIPSPAKAPNFEPFVAAIKRARRTDETRILRTDVGAHLSKADYEAIGLIGLKQVVQAAVAAGVIVTGGSEYNGWIGLTEWFSPRLDGDLVTIKSTEPAASNRPPVRIWGRQYRPRCDPFPDRWISSHLWYLCSAIRMTTSSTIIH